MLTSLVLILKAPTAADLPAVLGRASQALFYRLLDSCDPSLAARLHDAEGIKPYTVSNLVLGKRHGGRTRIEAGQTGWLRFTGLNADVSRALLTIAAQPPNRVELDNVLFAVTGATVDPAVHPWAKRERYQDFAAPFLLGGASSPQRRITLSFESPTTFRSQRKFIPFPLPEQVFGGLLLRWQTFAPVALNPEIRRFAEEAVVVSRYRLRTVSMPYKQGGVQVAFVGEATFTPLNTDRYWLNSLHLLANYAFYCGVGYQTTAGLGQTRLQSERRGSARKHPQSSN